MASRTGRRLIIPAAGNGRRFAEKGYSTPKPFIDVLGAPMLELVVRNMRAILGDMPALVILREDMREAAEKLALDDVEFVYEVDPRGTAATLLSVLSKHVATDEEIVLANSDQVVDFDGVDFEAAAAGSSGTILTFECPQLETKWSYAELDASGALVRVAEKNPISTHATVGVYRYAARIMLTDAIERMMAANDRTNGEFYLCPAYNYLDKGDLSAPRTVTVHAMYGLGTPEDLERTVEDPAFVAYVTRLIPPKR